MDPMNRAPHVIGRDPDGHRWPMAEGWRCMYCGIIDPRMQAVSEGHEPEILLASIESCKTSSEDKLKVDTKFPMTVKDGGKIVSEATERSPALLKAAEEAVERMKLRDTCAEQAVRIRDLTLSYNGMMETALILEESRDNFRMALIEFGEHKEHCASRINCAKQQECNCGLKAAEDMVIDATNPVLYVTGIISGDLECWCLLVSREDFVRIAKEEPNEWDIGHFAKEGDLLRYKLYPHNLMGGKHDGQVRISIKTADVKA